MIPPTPTLLPPGIPIVSIPDSYSLWASAPVAIQSWNLAGEMRGVIQAVFLITIVIICLFIFNRFIGLFRKGDEEE
jgi:hypothetical protein